MAHCLAGRDAMTVRSGRPARQRERRSGSSTSLRRHSLPISATVPHHALRRRVQGWGKLQRLPDGPIPGSCAKVGKRKKSKTTRRTVSTSLSFPRRTKTTTTSHHASCACSSASVLICEACLDLLTTRPFVCGVSAFAQVPGWYDPILCRVQHAPGGVRAPPKHRELTFASPF